MLGPDEKVYLAHGQAFRAGGVAAMRDLAEEFVSEPSIHAYPSPLRWLWAALVGLTYRIDPKLLQIAAWAAMAPILHWVLTPIAGAETAAVAGLWVISTPLAWHLSGKALQDVPVAALTLVALGFSLRTEPLGMAATLFALLSVKESAVFVVPALAAAWLIHGGPFVPLLGTVAGALVAWVAVLALLFGRGLPAMFKAAAAGHDTDYTQAHQRGAAHRLLVDLALASPAAVVFAILGAAKAPALAAAVVVLLAFHAIAPIRNVRTVLAADLCLRALGAFAMTYPLIEFPAVIAVDVLIARRLKDVYDPTTAALATALGMQPPQT